MTPPTMILEDGSEIVLQHFLVPAEGRSKAHLACLPGLTDFASGQFRGMPWIRTDEPRSVSCPMCKETQEYKAALVNLRNLIR